MGIVLVVKERKACKMVNVTIPGNCRVSFKERERIDKTMI